MVEQTVHKVTNWIGTPSSLILHTLFFIGIFVLRLAGVSFSDVMLILTTLVSLEAIYLSIFIQMTVNKHSRELQEVKTSVEEVQESVEEVQESVEEVQEGVQEIAEDEQKEDTNGSVV